MTAVVHGVRNAGGVNVVSVIEMDLARRRDVDPPVMGSHEMGSTIFVISAVGMFEFQRDDATAVADYLVQLSSLVRRMDA